MPKFMRKKKNVVKNVAEMQPDEINELRAVISEYAKRRNTIEREIETLKEDKKALREEFENKLDVKTLDLVEKHLRIKAAVEHADTFDLYLESLTDEASE